jgi:signal transduction histidine kinase/ActR/RegA family two-component response regulator
MSTNAVPVAMIDPFDLAGLCRYFSERSPEPLVAVQGPTHAIRYLNPAFSRLVCKTPEELIGRRFADAVPEGMENECVACLDRVFRTGTPEKLAEQEHRQTPPANWSYSMWAILGADERPAGVMIHVTDTTASAVFRRHAVAMNEALILSSVQQHELIDTIKQGERDRRELESQLFHTQKLESLGTLAGGIAHDLNNMLTPVLGFAELASDTLPEDHPAIAMLDEVRKNARRAADLVQQILAYAGKGQFVIQSVDLSHLVREMGGLLAAAISIDTELILDLATELPAVEVDIAQLQQVVINLVTNASEAIPARGGRIIVRTGEVQPDKGVSASTSSKNDLSKGPAVFLEVVDSGSGMAANVIDKIFDPFFTTKFIGRGLGLAVVQGIAHGHRGVLQVRSEPGQGSTFRLLLPCSSERVISPVVPGPTDRATGIGTILVVEDEKPVRDLASLILVKAGFTVIVASDGKEGVEVFREHQSVIDGVVLDMAMPRMGGLEAAKVLKDMRPNLPVVLMSGFSVQEVTLQSAGFGIEGFVQKPFNADELLTAVRHALGFSSQKTRLANLTGS